VPVVCSPTNGSVLAVGETTVTCNAADAFGNAAAPCSFTVTVSDTVAPVMTCPTGPIVKSACGNPAGTVVEFTVSASDACNGPVTVICSHQSGAMFEVGSTTVLCEAVDTSNNTNTCSFVVEVTPTDTTPPVVTCPANIVAECTGPDGAAVPYTGQSAVDNCDGAMVPACTPASGSTFALGPTTVTCSATDAANNTGTCTFTVTVVDTTPPVFVDPCPANQTLCSVGVATWTDPGAIDLCGSATVICNPPSGSTFQCGTNAVICTASDAAANTATCTFEVKVTCPAQPTLSYAYDATGKILTLTWVKSDCYKLHFRDNQPEPATDPGWTLYPGTVTDDGTTATAVITVPTTGNKFFLLK
jgi:hypothetical protein